MEDLKQELSFIAENIETLMEGERNYRLIKSQVELLKLITTRLED